ncbi:MAG: hypothetical protein M1823_003923 [Watsoniomyces obsoletus]|nr:MAG: hypothetical protein M1823_003923 [Watsoniomyces obsoletus]
MATRVAIKTTFEVDKSIQPIYTGGSVALDKEGRLLITTLGEDVLVTDLRMTPSASHLIICSRSLSLRIYALNPSLADDVEVQPELQRTLKPHASPVISSVTDATGTLLATGGAEGHVKVWDIRGGYVTHTFRGHGGLISALRFFELGGSRDGSSQDGRRKHQRRKDETSQKNFMLASGDEEGKIRIWDLQKRKCVSILDSHVSVVRGLDYNVKSNTLVSASRDKTLIIWDASSWKTRKVVPALEGIESVGFLAKGKYIYSAGEHGKIRIWSSKTGKEMTQEQESEGEGGSVVQVVYHQEIGFLLSVHNDQSLLLHSVEELDGLSEDVSIPPLPIIRRISGTHDEIIDLAYLLPDHSLMALATNTEDVRIISVARRSEAVEIGQENNYFGADVVSLKGHQDIIICLDVDWSGHWLATGAKDNTARLWRIDPISSSFTCFATFSGHAESLGAVALPKTKPSKDPHIPLDHPPPYLITGSQDQTIKRWDIPREANTSSIRPHKKSSQARYTRKAHDKDINSIDINASGTLFASASQDRTVKIWSVEEGEVQGILRGHRRGVWSVQFSPKNSPSLSTIGGLGGGSSTSSSSGSRGLVLTGSGDKTVKIWNLTDYTCLRTLEGHTNSVLKAVWLPFSDVPGVSSTSANNDDDNDDDDHNPSNPVHHHHQQQTLQLASAGSDGLVKIWDANTGECSSTLDNHTDRIWALTTSSIIPTHNSKPPHTPDTTTTTTTLVSGGADGTITFWKDTTIATHQNLTLQASERIEQDQRLQNLIHSRSYREAIILALQLDHPGRLLSLFTNVIYTVPSEEGSLSGILAVDEVLANLDDEQLWLLLVRIRDWNTTARTSPVAQRLLGVLVRVYDVGRFVGLKNSRKRRKGDAAALDDILDALKAYTLRHYERIEELVEQSYLIEYTLGEMREVLGDMGEMGDMDVDPLPSSSSVDVEQAPTPRNHDLEDEGRSAGQEKTGSSGDEDEEEEDTEDDDDEDEDDEEDVIMLT